MIKSIRNRKILLYILLLTALYLSGISFIFITRYSLTTNLNKIKIEKENQEIRNHICQDIQINLHKIEKSFFTMLTMSTPQKVNCKYREIDSYLTNIRQILSLLKNGGTHDHKYLLNLQDADEFTESLILKVKNNQAIPLEIIELTPKLIDVKELAKKFKLLVNERNKLFNNPKAFRDKTRSIVISSKSIQPLFWRMHENANYIYYNSMLERDRIQSLINRVTQKYIITEIIISAIVIIMIIWLTTIIINRIQSVEKKLIDSKSKYQSLVNNTTGIIYRCLPDENWTMLYLSPQIKQTSGYSEKDFIKNKIRSYTSIVHQEDKDQLSEVANKAIKHGKPWEIEYRINHKDGSIHWVYEKGTAITDKDNNVKFLDGFILDITDRKKAEQALKESEDRLKAFSEVSTEAIFFTDKGIFIDTNMAASKIYGYSHDEFIGQFATFIAAPESKELIKDNMLSGYDEPYDAIAMKKNGTKFPVEIYGTTYKLKGKKIRVTRARDITERKATENQLKRYSETQETLIKEVNHRVKNNLYAINGLLTKEKNKIEKIGNPVLSQFIDDLSNRVNNLLTVHSLLSASRWQPINLTELCRNIVTCLLEDMIKKDLVSLTIASVKINLNSFQVQQIALVINEIITNTIKYCKPQNEKIIINIDITFDEKQINVIIKDNGAGFPQKLLDNDFSEIGIGFDLIYGIVKKSLGGSVSIKNDNGAVVSITIRRMI